MVEVMFSTTPSSLHAPSLPPRTTSTISTHWTLEITLLPCTKVTTLFLCSNTLVMRSTPILPSIPHALSLLPPTTSTISTRRTLEITLLLCTKETTLLLCTNTLMMPITPILPSIPQAPSLPPPATFTPDTRITTETTRHTPIRTMTPQTASTLTPTPLPPFITPTGGTTCWKKYGKLKLIKIWKQHGL